MRVQRRKPLYPNNVVVIMRNTFYAYISFAVNLWSDHHGVVNKFWAPDCFTQTQYDIAANERPWACGNRQEERRNSGNEGAVLYHIEVWIFGCRSWYVGRYPRSKKFTIIELKSIHTKLPAIIGVSQMIINGFIAKARPRGYVGPKHLHYVRNQTMG